MLMDISESTHYNKSEIHSKNISSEVKHDTNYFVQLKKETAKLSN